MKPGRPKQQYTYNKYNQLDWHVVKPSRNKDKKYLIEQQIERCDNLELKLLQTITTNKDPVVFNDIYAYKNNKWILLGKRCTSCDKTFRNKEVIAKHKDLCKRINTTNNEETFMPIQKITKNGETFYRWGDQGKLYRNRSDAEKQAQAAYASGYKSNSMNGSKEKK